MIKKNNLVKLSGSVSISIGTNKILLRKGIWNYTFSEVSKDFFRINDWKQIIDFFINLSLKKFVNINEKKWNKNLLIPIIDQLWENEWISLNNKEIQREYDFNILVSNKNKGIVKNFFKKNKIFSWRNFSDNFLLNLPKDFGNNILCFFENQDISYIFLLNKFLFNKKYENVIFVIFDEQYLHIIIIGDFSKGCFECFSERILLKMSSQESQNFREFIEKIDKFKFSINKNVKNVINLASSLLNTSSIFNKNNKYFWNKSISIYLPTMEINYDKIFKIPNCSTCCNSSEGSKFYFSNYDLLKEIKDVK